MSGSCSGPFCSILSSFGVQFRPSSIDILRFCPRPRSTEFGQHWASMGQTRSKWVETWTHSGKCVHSATICQIRAIFWLNSGHVWSELGHFCQTRPDVGNPRGCEQHLSGGTWEAGRRGHVGMSVRRCGTTSQTDAPCPELRGLTACGLSHSALAHTSGDALAVRRPHGRRRSGAAPRARAESRRRRPPRGAQRAPRPISCASPPQSPRERGARRGGRRTSRGGSCSWRVAVEQVHA